jgi:hypothetical protein
MKKWGVGILEYWSIGYQKHHSILPLFHSWLRLAHGLQRFELFELFEQLELFQVVVERLAPRSLFREQCLC